MEKLRIYQTGLLLVKEIYTLTKNPKLAKDYSLCDQLRRASISVIANISEGYLRSHKHFKNYLSISSGSANETVALLQVVELVYEIPTNNLQQDFQLLARQIGSFSKKLKPDSD